MGHYIFIPASLLPLSSALSAEEPFLAILQEANARVPSSVSGGLECVCCFLVQPITMA
uniref:Uncharacterized protein n=1 Tax=Anguilla anguilla TaxID=7936 RepID=A0A0E9WKX3_ANGAN